MVLPHAILNLLLYVCKNHKEAALDFIRTWPCGKAEYCALSYEPENEAAAKLYHSMGFAENGEMDGDEIVAVLKL